MKSFISKFVIKSEILYLEQQLEILKDYQNQSDKGTESNREFYKNWHSNMNRIKSHWSFHNGHMERYFGGGKPIQEIYPIFEIPMLERERMDFERDMKSLRMKIKDSEGNSEEQFKNNNELMKVKQALNEFIDGYREYLYPHFRDFLYPMDDRDQINGEANACQS